MKLTIVIRFTNSLTTNEQIQDLEIPISVNLERDDVNRLVNVKWIKSLIRQKKVAQCGKNRLRLIYNGKVLNEHADFKKEIIEPRIRASQGGDTGQFYIHCFIGEELTDAQLKQENEMDNKPQQKTTLPEVIGFDRLLEQGFNQEDINDLRRQFTSVYGSVNGANSSREVEDVEEIEQRNRTMRQLEERWINSTINGTPTEGNTSSAGTATEREDEVDIETRVPPMDIDDTDGNEELIVGLLFGIFLGVVSLVFIMVDDTIFTKRQKMAVCMGIGLNVFLGISRGDWA